MKATKLITTAAVATLGLTLLAPTVLAEGGDAKKLTGNGSITYEEDTSTNPPVDPEIPTDPVDPIGPTNPDGGALSVDMVPNLKFTDDKGQNAKISTQQGHYQAAAAKTKNKKGDDVKRGNWVQITDKRALKDNKTAGWELKANMTQQFKNADGGVLKGATIDFTNPAVTTDIENGFGAGNPTGVIPGITATPTVQLSETGGAKSMAKAAAGSGFGTYMIQYGRSDEFNGGTDTSANSIKLTVPANTPLAASEYTAKITWTIGDIDTI
ncbi:MAG: WxL domain-containing protein [Vagococcus sp.]|uniref:WxL domain-containing protein n=1 Tax=Vagococcus sp. TaxID=1933889 RepID=UPI002FC6195E